MPYSDDNIISEKFWLNLAGESVISSFEKRANASEKLKKIIEWIFGLFTGTGFIIGIFKDVTKFPCETICLMGLGFAILIVAYALAGVAQYPVSKSFHPNDTEEIAAAFSEAVKKQSSFFNWASGITMLAFCSIAVGVLLLFADIRKKGPELCTKNNDSLITNAIIEKGSAKTYNIAVTVMTVPNAKVTVTIKGGNEKDSLIKYTALIGFPLVTDSAGRAYGSLVIPEGNENYWLQTTISEKKADTLIEKSKTIKLSKPGK